ncbi:MAG: DUF364 domain-containing protein [Desulfobacter sp.]|nr:MAG: DUF364 domain-containing protein [Desulfobacter sp.]
MKFIEHVAEKARETGGDERVKAVYIGLSYCYAELENGSSGLAFVFREGQKGGCTVNLPKRPLAGSEAGELLDFAGKGNLANSVCLAVANAVMAPLAKPDTTGDILDHIELTPGTRVGMVGHFGPLAPVIRKKGAELTVFDMHPEPLSGILPPDKIPDLMPDCDAALITATSIINETIDDILPHAAGCRHIAVLGPSTPLAAVCYEGTPVSCAAGVIVRDREGMIRAIAEAGGTKVFISYTDKVNVNFQAA